MSENKDAKILIVDDEAVLTASLIQHLNEEGYATDVAENESQAKEFVSKNAYDLVLLSLQLADVDNHALLKKLKDASHSPEIIALTNYGTISRAIEAVRNGAFYFIEKPFDFAELLTLIERALEHSALHTQIESFNHQLSTRNAFAEMIGASKQMQAIYETIESVAKTDANVLIVGESGTGKELVANAIHYNSRRNQKPFVKANCAAMQKQLFESELFGHTAGCLPLAHADKRGMVQYADGGTLLLDEVSEIPIEIQPKLLSLLEEKQYCKLGSDEIRKVNLRLITTTNRLPADAISEGLLSEDFFYCISTVTIYVPPLRERSDDIVLLAERFLDHYAKKYERNTHRISSTAYERLLAHNWPGNVRELQNIIERAALLAKSEQIEPSDLPFDNTPSAKPSLEIPENLTLEEIEKLVITKTLQRTLGNKQAAAQILGIYRPRLYSKIKKYGIDLTNLSSQAD
jgi:DNA-binding NtrC family response regulator